MTEPSSSLLVATLEASVHGVVLTDNHARILWANRAFSDMTGYERSEVLGKNPRIFNSGRNNPGIYSSLWTTILSGRPWHGELINRRKNGSLYLEGLTIAPVRGISGGITNFVAIKEDRGSPAETGSGAPPTAPDEAARGVDLNSVISQTAHLIGAIIGQDIDFDISLSSPLPAVDVERTWVEQILMNLSMNARERMAQGGRFRIETALVTERELVEGLPRGSWVRLTIAETAGPAAAVPAAVKSIVEKVGGRIFIESRDGGRSVFRVYLPGRQLAVPDVGPVVLLVEDEEGVRKFTRDVLADAGYTVLEAANGEEALRSVRTFGNRIHLMLTDVVMPGMNGVECAAEARAICPSIAVLYISGYVGTLAGRYGPPEEFTHLLRKPFDCKTLLAYVRRCLEGRAASLVD